MDKVTIFIDGKSITIDKNLTIMQVARKNNVFIPTLCYLKDCFNCGKCSLCMTEVTQDNKIEIVKACLEYSGAGAIFGASGGVMEAALRTAKDYKKLRASVLYRQDKNLPKRKAHKNEYIIKMYTDYVGEVGNKLAHDIFHVQY